jgi:hypothetical protein
MHHVSRAVRVPAAARAVRTRSIGPKPMTIETSIFENSIFEGDSLGKGDIIL